MEKEPKKTDDQPNTNIAARDRDWLGEAQQRLKEKKKKGNK